MWTEQDHYKKCKKASDFQISIHTEKEPMVLSIDVKWAYVQPIDLLMFFNLIPNTLKLSDVFEVKPELDHQYKLKGVIMFHSQHYYSYF